jgi:hypothetical protein
MPEGPEAPSKRFTPLPTDMQIPGGPGPALPSPAGRVSYVSVVVATTTLTVANASKLLFRSILLALGSAGPSGVSLVEPIRRDVELG